MLIAIIVIVGLSFLILSHEAGHFLVAKFFGLRVDEFGFGFPPRIFAKKVGDTEYSLNWLPFGGFVRIAGENDAAPNIQGEAAPAASEEDQRRLFVFQTWWKRSLIVVAGVVVNFIIGWFLISAVLMIGTPKALVISDIQKNSPAEAVGLKAGDIVEGYTDAASFISFVNANRGKEITLTVVRENKEITVNATPRAEVLKDQGALGVVLAEAGEGRLGFFASIWQGLKNAVLISGITFQAFYNLIKSLVVHGSLLEGVVGPVGIFSVAQETGKIGLIYLVQLIALISLNLAVINLIPFPALDGGRFFMILIERIKGSPISRKVEAAANAAGFAFLILLMVALTIRDVSHWF